MDFFDYRDCSQGTFCNLVFYLLPDKQRGGGKAEVGRQFWRRSWPGSLGSHLISHYSNCLMSTIEQYMFVAEINTG